MIQEKKRVLGRGLESLIPAARAVPAAAPAMVADAAGGEVVREIRLEEIEPNPYQPRRRQDEAALEELAQSIRAQGVLQPIVVRYITRGDGWRLAAGAKTADVAPAVDGGQGAAEARSAAWETPHPADAVLGAASGAVITAGDGPQAGAPAPHLRGEGAEAAQGTETRGTHAQVRYQLIAGERRWLASKRAGRETVPAIVRQVSNEQAVEMALIENIQREDLDCMEMSYAFERLSREFGLTQEQIAQRTGKDRGTIGNYLRLLKLPPEVRAALGRHDLSFGHAKELMSIDDPMILTTAAQKIMKDGLSVRATQELVNHLIFLGPMVGTKQEKPARVVDPNVRAAEQELERSLGCRVKINDNHGKGKIVIQYASLEDFDRVVEALGK